MEVVMSISRIDPGQRYAGAVVHGDLVFLAGHVGSDPAASVLEQTRDALHQIDVHLAAAGSDKSKLLAVQVWLADISTFAELNEAWDEWVDKANLPARATVEARLATPDYKVEIAGVAAR
jgi:enamine deaminase RidA (YjgF/YER057c/UK114 family)